MRALLLILFIQYACVVSASPTDSIISVLDAELEKRMDYHVEKEKNINELKQSLINVDNANERFFIYNKIFEEYKSYQSDSAYTYARITQKLSRELKDGELIEMANYNLMFCLMSAGLFKEAIDVLERMNTSCMSVKQKQKFYAQTARFYSEMGLENYRPPYYDEYLGHCSIYSDSALMILPVDSYEYNNVLALKTCHTQGVSLDDKIAMFEKIINPYDTHLHQLAINASILGALYNERQDTDVAIYYLALSAISDTRLAVTETASKTTLAILFYKLGDVERASRYIQASLDDANFYNSRHRKVYLNAILPIIDKVNVEVVSAQNNKLLFLLVFSCVCAVLFLVSALFNYKTNKKLKSREKIIQEQLDQLYKFTQELNFTHEQLKESNIIKDQYIIQSLYNKSDYYNKIESILKKIDNKLITRQYDTIGKLREEFDLKKERENMFQSFDKTFFLLFPTFVQEFNKLFPKDKQIVLEEANTLTLELRIFALLRLGITDAEKIGNFLNLSVNTIYAYKARIRNKALVPKEEFEYYVMRIERGNN